MWKLVIIFISFAHLSLASSKDVVYITSLNWQPYSGEDIDSNGTSVKKLRKILKEAGYELKVEYYPWKRARFIAKGEKYLGYFPSWPEEVDEGFVKSKNLDDSNISAIKLKEFKLHEEIKSFEKVFQRYKVGIIKTYNYPSKIKKLLDKYPKGIERAKDENSLYKMLLAKRVHFILSDRKVIDFYLKRGGIKPEDVVIDYLKYDIPLILAINKNYKKTKLIQILKKK